MLIYSMWSNQQLLCDDSGGISMPFQKIVMPTMKELFVRQMESMILSGELAAGEQLPNERELSAQMNISRTVVNSGIQELAKNGFVCIVPRKGTFVNDFLYEGNLGTLTSIFHHNDGQFDKPMLTSLMEYRSINEQKCARLAAERRTEENMKDIFELLEQLETCRDPDSFAETSTTVSPCHFHCHAESGLSPDV